MFCLCFPTSSGAFIWSLHPIQTHTHTRVCVTSQPPYWVLVLIETNGAARHDVDWWNRFLNLGSLVCFNNSSFLSFHLFFFSVFFHKFLSLSYLLSIDRCIRGLSSFQLDCARKNSHFFLMRILSNLWIDRFFLLMLLIACLFATFHLTSWRHHIERPSSCF